MRELLSVEPIMPRLDRAFRSVGVHILAADRDRTAQVSIDAREVAHLGSTKGRISRFSPSSTPFKVRRDGHARPKTRAVET